MITNALGLVVVDHAHLLLELLLGPDVVLLSTELVGQLLFGQLIGRLGFERMRDVGSSEVNILARLDEASKSAGRIQSPGQSACGQHG